MNLTLFIKIRIQKLVKIFILITRYYSKVGGCLRFGHLWLVYFCRQDKAMFRSSALDNKRQERREEPGQLPKGPRLQSEVKATDNMRLIDD